MSSGYEDFYVPAALTFVSEDVTVPVSISSQEVNIQVELVASSVTLDVNITNPVLNVNITGSDVTLDVNIKSSVTLNVNITGVDSGVTFNVNITGSETTINVNISGVESGVVFNVNITNAEINVKVTNTVNINIESSSVTLDVNISGVDSDVTFNVNVTNAVLNVQVQGTASVSIDNATVYLNVKQEFRLGNYFLYRCFSIGSGDTDLDVYTNKWSLFIPRGCRAWLYRISPVVKNTSGSNVNITIELSIAPKYPPLYTTTLTVPATQTNYDIVNWILNIYWPYESMYITVKASASGVYLEGQDGKWGEGGYIDDIPDTHLPNFEIVLLSKPEGDIPVSGTVNTIAIPNISSSTDKQSFNVPASSASKITLVEGIGKLLYLFVWLPYENVRVRLEADGNIVWTLDIPVTWFVDYYRFDVADAPIKYVKTYHPDLGWRIAMHFSVPVSFRKKLVLKIQNNTSSDISGFYIAIYEVIQ